MVREGRLESTQGKPVRYRLGGIVGQRFGEGREEDDFALPDNQARLHWNCHFGSCRIICFLGAPNVHSMCAMCTLPAFFIQS
jgi:hypothetical protein